MNWPADSNHLWEIESSLFRRTIPDPARHSMHARDLGWHLCELIRKRQIFDKREAIQRRIPQIVSFTYNCAPPCGSQLGLVTAAEFLICFFLFNDFWPEHVAFADYLGPFLRSTRQAFIADWTRGIEGSFGRDSERLLSSFAVYAISLDHERALKRSNRTVSAEEFEDRVRGRYQWVGTSPYIDLWELTEGLLLSPSELNRTAKFKHLGVEMTYIANDIGSSLRDDSALNIVSRLAQDSDNPTHQEGVDRAVHLYSSKAAEFLNGVTDFTGAPPRIRNYINMVAGVTDGNRDMTASLSAVGNATRYAAELSSCIAGLPALGQPLSP